MSPEEIEATVKRGDQDPTLKAVIEFVEAMGLLVTAEATGFYTASVLNAQRDEVKAKFVVAMEKANVPSEG
jgi:hypothetical protein